MHIIDRRLLGAPVVWVKAAGGGKFHAPVDAAREPMNPGVTRYFTACGNPPEVWVHDTRRDQGAGWWDLSPDVVCRHCVNRLVRDTALRTRIVDHLTKGVPS